MSDVFTVEEMAEANERRIFTVEDFERAESGRRLREEQRPEPSPWLREIVEERRRKRLEERRRSEPGLASRYGRAVWQGIRDSPVLSAKAAVGLAQSATGLADIMPVTAGHPASVLMTPALKMTSDPPLYGWSGWMQENLGIRYEDTQDILYQAYSPELKEGYRKVSEAKGLLGKLGAALKNPAVISTTIGESVPQMMAGGAIGKGLRALPVIGKYGYAIGEGLISAGAGAEQTRAESPSGLLTERQVGIHVASGVLTTAIGMFGAKVTKWLGIDDIDVLLAGGISNAIKRNVLIRVVAGAFVEGGIEESSQSVQEQIASNIANGRLWYDGWDESLVLGTLSGMGVGGAIQARPRPRPNMTPEARLAELEATHTPKPDGGVYVSEAEGREHGIPGDTRKERMQNLIQEEQQLTQELQDASPVRSPEAQVREEQGREDIHRPREVQVPAEPAGEVAPAREIPRPEEAVREEQPERKPTPKEVPTKHEPLKQAPAERRPTPRGEIAWTTPEEAIERIQRIWDVGSQCLSYEGMENLRTSLEKRFTRNQLREIATGLGHNPPKSASKKKMFEETYRRFNERRESHERVQFGTTEEEDILFAKQTVEQEGRGRELLYQTGETGAEVQAKATPVSEPETPSQAALRAAKGEEVERSAEWSEAHWRAAVQQKAKQIGRKPPAWTEAAEEQPPAAPEPPVEPGRATELPSTVFHGTKAETAKAFPPETRPRNVLGNDLIYTDERRNVAQQHGPNVFELEFPQDAKILDYGTPEGSRVYDALYREAVDSGLEGAPKRHKYANDKLREQGWDAIVGFHGPNEFAILKPERFPSKVSKAPGTPVAPAEPETTPQPPPTRPTQPEAAQEPEAVSEAGRPKEAPLRDEWIAQRVKAKGISLKPRSEGGRAKLREAQRKAREEYERQWPYREVPPVSPAAPESPQQAQVKAFVEGAKERGEPTALYKNKQGQILVATEDEHGLSRVVVNPDGSIESLGAGPVDTTRWTLVSPAALEAQAEAPQKRRGRKPVSQPPSKTEAKETAAEEGEGTAKFAPPTRQSRSVRRKAEGEKVGIAAADIMKTVEREFGVAVRQGGFSARSAGIYKWLTKRDGPPSPEVARTAEEHYANLAVVAHEVAHHVDEKTKAVQSMPKPVRDEVKRLDYEPEKGRAFEGFAEFLRRYITEPPIDVAGVAWVPNPGLDAPKTLAWFEDTFLRKHKDVAKQIANFQEYAQQFAQQSVFQRIGTLIADRQPQDLSFKARWLKKAQRKVSRQKKDFVDKFHTLEWIQEAGRQRGHKGIGIYDLTMAYFMSASSRATIAFEEGVRSLQTGKPIGTTSLWGLRDHLESDGEYNDAILYALARHTIFMDEAKPGYNTVMELEDAEAWIDEVEVSGKRDRYEAFAKDLARYNNDLINMLVEAGALPASEADKMLKAYGGLNYFPLHRVQDAERSMFAGAGVGFVNLGRAVPGRSAKGSGRQIVDPIDATVARTMRFYGRAIRARQQHVLAETLDPLMGGVGGMGGLMDRVDPRKKVTHGKIEEILKTLLDEGIIEADDAKAMRIAAKILHPEETGLPSATSLEWFAERHRIAKRDAIEQEEGEVEYDIDALLEAAAQEPDALAVISLWRPDYTPNSQKRTVVIYDKQGNPLMYEMDPELYATATGMDELQFGPFMSTLRAAARYFKSGAVGLSTGFGTANLLRDYWEFQGKARHTKGLNSLGKPPEMLGRYVYEKARKLAGQKANDPLIRLYEESGGKVYSIIGHDVHGRQMYRRRRIGKSLMSKLGVSAKHPRDTAEGALQAVQEVIAVSDAPPRIADAEAAIKEEGYVVRRGKWFNTKTGEHVDELPEHLRIKAAVAMAEATINFKRIGAKGQYIEAFMPFFNATVQAMYRQYGQLKGMRSLGRKDAEGMRAKRYLVYLSALAAHAVLYWLFRHDDDDWREQDAYLRDGYWTWGKDGKTYVRIPKPRDTAVVSNVAENMLDAWYHEDARGMDDVLLRDLGGRVPTGGGFVRGGIETYVADYDYFRERELTPEYLKDLPKEQQITPYTTRASGAIGSVTGRYLGTSPIQVEHLLNSSSGGFYRRMADFYDAAADGRLGPEHIPFVRGVVIDRHQARSVNDFYDEKEDTDIAAHREEAAKDKVSDKTLGKQAVLAGYAELMTKLRDMEVKVGKRRGYEHQPYIVGLARNALGYQELESNPNPLTDDDAPDAIKAVMEDYSMRAVNQALDVEKEKSEYKDEEAYDSARRTRIRGEAKLKALGVSHDEAQKLLMHYFRKTHGRLTPSYKPKAKALAELYGADHKAWTKTPEYDKWFDEQKAKWLKWKREAAQRK